MEKRLFLILVACLMIVSPVAAQKYWTGYVTADTSDYDVQDSLQEGQTKMFTVDGNEYKITLIYLGDLTKFVVNDEITDSLAEGERDTLSDESQIEVASIGADSATFSFTAGEGSPIANDFDIKDYLSEGQTKTYTIQGVNYEVNVPVVHEGEARLIINGRFTKELSSGDYEDLNFLRVSVLDVDDNSIYFTLAYTNTIVASVSINADIRDYLFEGESKSYTIDGVTRGVGVLYSDGELAKFTVGGVVTNLISVDGSYSVEGWEVKVLEITGDLVEFALTKVSNTGDYTCSDFSSQSSCLDHSACYWDQETDRCYDYDGVTSSSCSDPDFGENRYSQAHTFGFRENCANSRDCRIRTGGRDACLSSTQVREHYCDSGFIRTTTLDCPSGCQDGGCLNPTVTCTDSDGGKDYYTKGKGSGSYDGTIGVIWGDTSASEDNDCGARWDRSINTSIHYDCCTNDVQLNEAYCDSDGLLQSTAYQCPNGCSDGACVRETNYRCSDSDGGLDIFTKGSASNNGKTLQDYCIDEDKLNEMECVYSKSPVTGEMRWAISQVNIECPIGCSDGACIDSENTQECSDSDGGKNLYVQGTLSGVSNAVTPGEDITDYCQNGNVFEFYCKEEGSGSYAGDLEKCPYGCENGACVKEGDTELVPKPLCPDVLCEQPPANCEVLPSNELDVNGCPVYPCGRIICTQESEPEQEEEREQAQREFTETGVCNGCNLGERCLPSGTRFEQSGVSAYCNFDGSIARQKDEGVSCQNNYECLTNECSSGECIDLQAQLEEQQNMLQKILDWLGGLFG